MAYKNIKILVFVGILGILTVANSQTDSRSRSGVLKHVPPPPQTGSISSESLAREKAKIMVEDYNSNLEEIYLFNREQELRIQEETGIASDVPRFSHPFVSGVTIVHEYAGTQIESPLVQALQPGERSSFERNVSQKVLKILIQFNKDAFGQEQSVDAPEAFIFPGFPKLHADNGGADSIVVPTKEQIQIFKQTGKASYELMQNFKLDVSKWKGEKLLAVLPGGVSDNATTSTETFEPADYLMYIKSVLGEDDSHDFFAPFSVSPVSPSKPSHELPPLFFRVDMEGLINKLNEEWGVLPDTAVIRAIQEQYAKKNGKEALAKALKDGSLKLPSSFFHTPYNPIKEHPGKIYFYFSSQFPHQLITGDQYKNRPETLGAAVQINTGFLKKTPQEFVDYWKKFGQSITHVGDPKKGEFTDILPNPENVYLSQNYSLVPQPRWGANHLAENFEIHQLVSVKEIPEQQFLEKIKAHNIDPQAINKEGDIIDLSYPVEFAGVAFKFEYQSNLENKQCLDKYSLSDVLGIEAVLGGRDKTDFGCAGCNTKGVAEVERDPQDFDVIFDPSRGSIAYKDKKTGSFYELREEIKEVIDPELGPYIERKAYLWDTQAKKRHDIDPADQGKEPSELAKKIFGKIPVEYELKINPESLKVVLKDGKKMLQLSGSYTGPDDKGQKCRQTAIYRTEAVNDDKLQLLAHLNLPNLNIPVSYVKGEPLPFLFGGPIDTEKSLIVDVDLRPSNLLSNLKKNMTADEANQLLDQTYMQTIVVPFLGSFQWNQRFNGFKSMILAYEEAHEVTSSKIENIELTQDEKRILGEIFFVTPEEFKKSGEEGKLFLKRVAYFMRENQKTFWAPLIFVHKHFEGHYQAFREGHFFSVDGLREIVLTSYMDFLNTVRLTAQNENSENLITQTTGGVLEAADKMMEGTGFAREKTDSIIADIGYSAYDTYLLMRYLATYLFVQPVNNLSKIAQKNRQLWIDMQNPFKTKEEVYAEMGWETLGLALDASVVVPMATAMARFSGGPLLTLARRAMLNNMTRTVGEKVVVDVPRYVAGKLSATSARLSPMATRFRPTSIRIPQTLTARLRAMPGIRLMAEQTAQELAPRLVTSIPKTQSNPVVLKAWRSLSRMRRTVAKSHANFFGVSTKTDKGVLKEARDILREMRMGTWKDINTRGLLDKLCNAHYLSQMEFNQAKLSQELMTELKVAFLKDGGGGIIPADVMNMVRVGQWPELITRLEGMGVISKAGRLRYLMDLGEELRMSDTIVRYLTEVRRLLGKKIYSTRPHGEARAILQQLDEELNFLQSPGRKDFNTLVERIETLHTETFGLSFEMGFKAKLKAAFEKTGLMSERNGVRALSQEPFFHDLFRDVQYLSLKQSVRDEVLAEENGELLLDGFTNMVRDNYLKEISKIDAALAAKHGLSELPLMLQGENVPTFGEFLFKELVNSTLRSATPFF